MQLQSDKTAYRKANSGQFSCKDTISTSMIASSTQFQHPSPFYSSSIMNINSNSNNCYNNLTTIPRSAPTLTRHHPRRHQSKTVTHRRRIRSSTMIADSGRRLVSPQHQQRALTKYEHHRSFKYTRTLDIILEDQQDSPEEPRLRRQRRAPFCLEHNNKNETEETTWLCTTTDANQNLQTYNHNDNNRNTFLATDFWHSMRSMKKSVASVSLESLVVNANDGDNDDENQSPNKATCQIHNNNYVPPNLVLEESENEDFENFLDVWKL
jgi:hypothetical protein